MVWPQPERLGPVRGDGSRRCRARRDVLMTELREFISTGRGPFLGHCLTVPTNRRFPPPRSVEDVGAAEDDHKQPADACDAVARLAESGGGASISDFPDDVLERAASSTYDRALTLGYCTFNLIECPIGAWP